MLPAVTAFTVFQRDAAEAAPPPSLGSAATEAEIDYFRETMPNVTSVDDIVEDERLYRFLTKAFGYGDTPPETFITKFALEQGVAEADAYVNSWPDYRLKNLVRSVGLAEFGTRTIRSESFLAGVSDRFRAEATGAAASVELPRSVQVDLDYFKENIADVENAADLLSDFRLYATALKAFGLEERIGDRALIRQALEDGVADDNDLANRIGDRKLQEFVRLFGFAEVETRNVSDDQFGETIAQRYIQELRLDQPEIDTRRLTGNELETAYFREKIGSIESVDELIEDRRLYAYVLTAFDLQSDIPNRGLVRKVLEEGIAAGNTIANRLPDPRYRDLAHGLALAEFGTDNLRNTDVVDGIVARYERVQLEIAAGQEKPAVELAAYFDRKADGLTSWFFVTADSRLRQVAFTALGLPDAAAGLNVDKLVGELSARFDIADFQDPEKRANFLRRYLALSDVQSGGSATTIPGAVSVSLLAQTAASGASLYGLISQL